MQEDLKKSMKKLYAVVFGIAVSVSLASCAQAQEAKPVVLTPPSVPVPGSYFGLHLHRWEPDAWPRVPFSGLRMWDTKGATWYVLEPHKGQWDFRQLDQDVTMAEAHQANLLLTLGQTPQWASQRPTEPPTYRLGAAAPPRDPEDWKNYVRTVATRYKGRIHEYEIWNEPNLKEFYSGTREELFALQKDAYDIIHGIDPTAIVVSPSITGGYAVGWFNHYLDLGAGKYADAIGYHFYASPHDPEDEVEIIQQVEAAMRSHGINKPLWNTESGYLIASDFQPVATEHGTLSRLLSHQEALGYIMRSYLVDWAAGVSRLYWYDWDGSKMGLGDNSGRQNKPAAEGYKTIEQWLNGAVVRRCSSDEKSNWTCEISQSNHPAWIVWNTKGPFPQPIPASWNVKQATTLTPAGTIIRSKVGDQQTVLFSPIPTLLQ